MDTQRYTIKNENDWQQVIEALLPHLHTGAVVTLRGTLGAGKTTFARGLIHHLAGKPVEVPSPTFTLVQEYDLPGIEIWHFDLYRMEEDPADILELGWEDARRYGVALVEWPERLGALLPRDRIDITIDFSQNEGERVATLERKR